jgi:hypothetical protein
MFIHDDKNRIEKLKFMIIQWAGPALPEYGLLESEIPMHIPKALRDLYLFAGNWPHPRDNRDHYFMPGKQPRMFQEQDVLLGVDNLKCENGRITFLMENQGNWTCEVDVDDDHSPVYCDAAKLWDDSIEEHEIVCQSLEHFLVTFCLQEMVFSSKFVGTLNGNLDQELFREKLEPIWLNGLYTLKEPTHSFYLCGDNLMIMDDSSTLWYAAKDESALALIVDAAINN